MCNWIGNGDDWQWKLDRLTDKTGQFFFFLIGTENCKTLVPGLLQFWYCDNPVMCYLGLYVYSQISYFSFSRLCLHLQSEFCWVSEGQYEGGDLYTQESGSSAGSDPAVASTPQVWLLFVALLKATFMLSLSLPFFLSLSISGDHRQGHQWTEGREGKKWRCLCVQETPCPID